MEDFELMYVNVPFFSNLKTPPTTAMCYLEAISMHGLFSMQILLSKKMHYL